MAKFFYELSFSFFVVLTGLAVMGSVLSLVLPALFAGSNSSTRNWNVIAIIAAYVVLAGLSFIIYLSRKITIVQKLRHIPKNLMVNKEGDVPSVRLSISQECGDRLINMWQGCVRTGRRGVRPCGCYLLSISTAGVSAQ